MPRHHRARHRGGVAVEVGFGSRGIACKHLGQAEVEYLHHAVVRELDVRGLEVAVDDAAFMRVLERVGELDSQWERFIDRHRPASDALGKCRAVDEFHYDRAHAAFVNEAVHLGDVRVIESSECLRLAIEACEALGPRLRSGRP